MLKNKHEWDEEALTRSSALESLAIAAVITDRNANILYVNKAFETITGYTSSEALGRKMSLLKSGYQSKEFYSELWRTIRENGQWKGMLWNKRKNGDVYHESLNISSFTGPSGDICYVGIFSDISEQDALQRALIDAQKRELLTTLSGGIAHNFNNYLAAIHGFAYLGHKVSTDDKVKRYLSEIIRATDKTSLMIKDLMKISRPSDNKEEVIDLSKHMMGIMSTAKSILPEAIEFAFNVKDEDSCEICGNISDVEQVILNILANARDAVANTSDARISMDVWHSCKSPARCQAYCRYYRDCSVHADQNVIIRVEDNGPGIPEEIQNKIFHPFFTTKAPDKGTGLGLASVSQIVSRLGGAIWVTSRANGGTHFYICLPRLPASQATA